MIRILEAGTTGDGRMESTSLACASATLTVSGVTGHFRVARPGGEFGADRCSFVGQIANQDSILNTRLIRASYSRCLTVLGEVGRDTTQTRD
jgi:hypothetical protein